MESKRNIGLIRLFFLSNIFQGIYTFLQLLQLPASESDRAIFLGFSPTRLLMVLVCILGILVFLILFSFIFKKKSPVKKFIFSRTDNYFSKYDFPLTILLAVFTLVFFTGITLEILLNPKFFPRAIIYLYLYKRIRPQFLWSVFICGEISALLLILFWRKNSKKIDSSKTAGGFNLISILCVLISWASMIILWIFYSKHLQSFPEFPHLPFFLVVIFILLNIPLILSIFGDKSEKNC